MRFWKTNNLRKKKEENTNIVSNFDTRGLFVSTNNNNNELININQEAINNFPNNKAENNFKLFKLSSNLEALSKTIPNPST